MTAPIEDISDLPGKKVSDQEENPIGEVKEVYAVDGDGHPMWVTVEASFGMGDKRTVFIPLARLKDEEGELRVPYSKEHVGNAPEVDASDGISDECERQLRDHYGIDRADQELRGDNKSYATLVPEEEDAGTAKAADDVEQLDMPDADRRTEETKERLHDPGSGETRDVDAGAIADENASEDENEEGEGDSGERDAKEQEDDSGERDAKEQEGDSGEREEKQD